MATSFSCVSSSCTSHEKGLFDRTTMDDLNDLDVNNAICGLFMSFTLQAAVHLGRDYLENLRFTKKTIPEVCGTVVPSD